MDLKIESGDGILLATIAGELSSLPEAVECLKKVYDAAAEGGLDKILLDCLAVKSRLSEINKYGVIMTMVQYSAELRIFPKVAWVGQPPAVTGFGALLQSNRGRESRAFPERQEAVDWLNQ